jgi:hypothetical protein
LHVRINVAPPDEKRISRATDGLISKPQPVYALLIHLPPVQTARQEVGRKRQFLFLRRAHARNLALAYVIDRLRARAWRSGEMGECVVGYLGRVTPWRINLAL